MAKIEAKAATATLAVAYSYFRFSKPEQATGDSVRRQTELRDAWLERNAVTLDTTLTLADKGVSGFTGDHRANPDRHALAAFLELVKQKRIAAGSFLIVESLDRLSREDIWDAMDLLNGLVRAGIKVVQLHPVEQIIEKGQNPMVYLMAVMEMMRGNSESRMKSERIGAAWREKKRNAAANGKPMTAMAPAWLRLADGKWEVIEEAAEAVRRIFRLVVEGHGVNVITKRLNGEGIAPIGKAAYWSRSSVAKIVHNRAVIGEYQPFVGRRKKRKREGAPVPDYYPAVVTQRDYDAARRALEGRRNMAGRISRHGINVFANLLRDSRDGSPLHQANRGKGRDGRALVSFNAVHRAGYYPSFPFAVFERAVLSCLREIDPRDVLPKKDRGADAVLELSARMEEVAGEIEKVKARLRTRFSDALDDVLQSHEAEQRLLSEQLAHARQEAASPAMEAWGQCQSLIDALDTAAEPEELRARLRAAIRRVVDSVHVLIVARGLDRIAAVQIWFSGKRSGECRSYVIFHRPAHRGRTAETRPAQWWCRSLASVAKLGKLDLRKPGDAARLEKALLAAQLPATKETPGG
jgi:DNA invertase Pin-like site-specific DNA recombinase